MKRHEETMIDRDRMDNRDRLNLRLFNDRGGVRFIQSLSIIESPQSILSLSIIELPRFNHCLSILLIEEVHSAMLCNDRIRRY